MEWCAPPQPLASRPSLVPEIFSTLTRDARESLGVDRVARRASAARRPRRRPARAAARELPRLTSQPPRLPPPNPSDDTDDDLARLSKRRRHHHTTVASPAPARGVNLAKPSDEGAGPRARSPALSPELAAKASALSTKNSTRGFESGSPTPHRAAPSPPPLVDAGSSDSEKDNVEVSGARSDHAASFADGGGATGSPRASPSNGAADDDEAFARRLQEEENARYEAEREESRRRAAEWRRAHEAMMAAAEIEEDLDENLEGDEDEVEDEDERDDDEDDVGVDGVPGIDALGDEGVGAGGAADAAGAGSARDARRAARRALARARRAQMTELRRFMGALHRTVNAAGETSADRAQLVALVMSDRDFTEDDYERLLALDNVVERRGVSAPALRRMPCSEWGDASPSSAPPSSCEDHARCAICLEDYAEGESLRHLPCLHSYHAGCVDRWFEHSVECPVCKCDVNALMNEQD